MDLYNGILDLIFPPKCPFCRRILSNHKELCEECQLPWTSVTKDTAFYTQDNLLCFSPFWYQDVASTAVKRYKFSGATHYAPCFAQWMARTLEGVSGIHYISWVPLSKMRRWQRGYNQAELLAKEVGQLLEIPTIDLLAKIKNNAPQTSLKSDRARRHNTQGVYRLKDVEVDLQDLRIVLVDDVITTGSSLYSCGKILQNEGVQEVICLTFARARK